MYEIYQKVLKDDISDISYKKIDYNLNAFFDFLKELKIKDLEKNK